MSAERILAIDVGTQSVRAIVFDPRGHPVASAKVPITPYVSPRPGWAEQDPELYWRSIGEACRRLWAGGGALDPIGPMVRPNDIAGVAATPRGGAPPLRPPVGVVELAARRPMGRFGRLPGRPPAVRFQGDDVGQGRQLEM